MRWIRTHGRRARVASRAKLALPARPVGAHRENGTQPLTMRGDLRQELPIAMLRIAIERRRQITDPRRLNALPVEHTQERRRLRVGDVSKGIATDERVDVDHVALSIAR